MYDGYLNLGGVEIGNAARWSAYTRVLGVIAGGQGCPCPYLPDLLADVPYQSAVLDPAPWLDPDREVSERFAGLLITEVTGLPGSTIEREVVRGVYDGAVQGRALTRERTIGVTGWIAAAGQDALTYGLQWLAAALEAGTGCDAGQCAGDTMCILSACPDSDPADADDAWAELARTLHDVALVSGPVMTEKHKLRRPSCDGRAAWLGKVEFTLVAGTPWVFGVPVEAVAATTFDPPPAVDCLTQWLEVGEGRATCPPVVTCDVADRYADPSTAAPAPPAAPRFISPINCVDRFTDGQLLVAIPPGTMPGWSHAVPIITVDVGNTDMRRLTLRFYRDTLGVGCPEDPNPCVACAEITVTFLPEESVVVIDGRSQTVTATFAGQVTDLGDVFLFGAGGGPVDWPILDCGAGMCVQILVDGEYYDPAATVTIELATRADLV